MDEKNYNLSEEVDKTDTDMPEDLGQETNSNRRLTEIRIEKRTDVKESGD